MLNGRRKRVHIEMSPEAEMAVWAKERDKERK